jgi:calcineurin-like phosphoesterase family protein
MKIVLEKGQQIFFTSDTHYNHANICRGTTNWKSTRASRDFDTIPDMNEVIVNNLNDKVGENDILIHLGDWSFGGFDSIREFRERIKCKNIILFFGNHDHHVRNNKNDIKNIFMRTLHYDQLDIRRPSFRGQMDKFSFVCMHFPIASWDNMNAGMIHLHGHVHLPKEQKIHEGRAMDVGVDGNDLTPYSMDEVLELMKDRPTKKLVLPSDHHEERLI